MILKLKYIILFSVLLSICSCHQKPRDNANENITKKQIDTLRTLSSFKQLAQGLYEISIYGDYSNHMKEVNHMFINHLSEFRYNCSIFSCLGDSSSILMGRSLDNGSELEPKHHTLVCKCFPENKYASISVVRLTDLGFVRDTSTEHLSDYDKITNFSASLGSDLTRYSFTQKLKLFDAPYYSLDGINEKGLAVALANYYPAGRYDIEPGKDTISYTYLVRKILDNCRNVDEATELIKSFNVVFYCESNHHFSTSEVHLMVVDSKGNSVIPEVYDGKFQFIRSNQAWQIATNSRTYDLSEDYKIEECFRYDTLHQNLQKHSGKLNYDQSLNLLKKVGFPFTQWSTLYDLSNKKVLLAQEYNFDNIYEFRFKDSLN